MAEFVSMQPSGRLQHRRARSDALGSGGNALTPAFAAALRAAGSPLAEAGQPVRRARITSAIS